MYNSLSDAMIIVRETSLGTCFCQHRFEGRLNWIPVGCGGCRSLLVGRGIVCGCCGVKLHYGCVLKGYSIACHSRDRNVA
jgi:hypothetical protein